MKIKILTFIIALVTFVGSTHATVYYKGKQLRDIQTYTIKGFCYDVSHSVPDPDIKHWRPRFAQALVWLDKHHQSKKTYHLEKIQSFESKTIRDAIDMIIAVLAGEYPNITPEIALHQWVQFGRRVIVEYSETTVINPQTKKQEKHIAWKFALKAPPSVANPKKTQKLLYHYPITNIF
jgi:hypothetical protein